MTAPPEPLLVTVTGAGGMLGRDLIRTLEARNHRPIALRREDLDITDPVAVAERLVGMDPRPRWVINAAAYTHVDRAESDRQAAFEVNGLGPSYLATAAALAGIRVLHVSTDYVFDGTSSEGYREDALPNPLGVYGESKLQGERAVLMNAPGAVVVRTSWLFGTGGPCFPRTILRLVSEGKPLRIVDDQIGRPTATAELAGVLVRMVEQGVDGGVYHAAGPEAMSWHGFARRILAQVPGAPEPSPIPTVEFPTPARRPAHSVLEDTKLGPMGLLPMAPLDESIASFLRDR